MQAKQQNKSGDAQAFAVFSSVSTGESVNRRIDSLARSAASRFILDLENRSGIHQRESVSVRLGRVPLGARETGADGREIIERQRHKEASEAQRAEVFEIYRGAIIEAAFPVGLPPRPVPSGWAVCFGHARIMGHLTGWHDGEAWREARAEGSRRCQRYLYGEDETKGETPVDSLEWLAEEGQRREALAGALDSFGDAGAVDMFAAGLERARGEREPAGSFSSFEALAEAVEDSGEVLPVPWDGAGAYRSRVMARAWDEVERGAVKCKAPVREFLAQARRVTEGAEALPVSWLSDPDKGSKSGIVRGIRERAIRARKRSPFAWADGRRGDRIAGEWLAFDERCRVDSLPGVMASRFWASAAGREFRRGLGDRFEVFNGSTVRASVGAASVGSVLPFESCAWEGCHAIPGASPFLSRGLGVEFSPGSRFEAEGWRSPVPFLRDGLRVARPDKAARLREVRGLLSGRGVDWDTYFFLLARARRIVARDGLTGSRAAFLHSEAWRIASDRQRASVARVAIEAERLHFAERFEAWELSRAGQVARQYYRDTGRGVGFVLRDVVSVDCVC